MSELMIELFKGKPSSGVYDLPGRSSWYIRFVAANGETVAVSEGYATKWNAKRAARKLFPGYELREV